MNNFDSFEKFLSSFSNTAVKLRTTLHDASRDDNGCYVYGDSQQKLDVLSLDWFVDKVFRPTIFPDGEEVSNKYTTGIKELNIKSIDSFVIDKKGNWYLIEFKNQKIRETKASVEGKAYQTYWWICNLFFKKMKKSPSFDYSNPVDFAKKKIDYILVVPKDKNEADFVKMETCEQAKEKFRPLFMEKIRRYLFHDAYVYTSELFENYFVKKFAY